MAKPRLLLGLILTYGAATGAAAQTECGHCHDGEEPFPPYEEIHQMTKENPKFAQCSGGGGHMIHDCENGDGTSWTYEYCEVDHPTIICEEQFASFLATLLRGPPVTATEASRLASQYPTWFRYNGKSLTADLQACDGIRVMTLQIVAEERPAIFRSRASTLGLGEDGAGVRWGALTEKHLSGTNFAPISHRVIPR